MSDLNTIIVRAFGNIYEVLDPVYDAARDEITGVYRPVGKAEWLGEGLFPHPEALVPKTMDEILAEQEINDIAEALQVSLSEISYEDVKAFNEGLADALADDGFFDDDAFVALAVEDFARLVEDDLDTEEDNEEYEETTEDLVLVALTALADLAADEALLPRERIAAAEALLGAVTASAEALAFVLVA